MIELRLKGGAKQKMHYPHRITVSLPKFVQLNIICAESMKYHFSLSINDCVSLIVALHNILLQT